MSRRAWGFLLGVMLLGLVVAGLAQHEPPRGPNDWLAFAVLTMLATASQLVKALLRSRHPSARGNLTLSPLIMFLFAGVLLLPASLYVAMVAVPHLIAWIRSRASRRPRSTPWFVHPFNIATQVISGHLAGEVYGGVYASSAPAFIPLNLAAASLAAIVFVVLNCGLLSLALSQARAVPFGRSGLFTPEILSLELITTGLGYVVALLWGFGPWTIVPALAPLLLIWRALRVPQLEKEARLFETARDGILLVNGATGEITDVNPGFTTLFGYPRREVLGLPLGALALFGAVPPDLLALPNLLQRGGVEYDAMPLRDSRGRRLWVEFACHAYGIGQESVIQCTLRDVTERKRADQELRENEKRYRALFEQSNDAVFIVSLDRKLLAMNQAAQNLLGYTRQEMIGKPAISNASPEEGQADLQTYAQLIAGETVPYFERGLLRKDGKRILVEVNLSLVQDGEGQPWYIQAIVRDITQRKQAEEVLRQAKDELELTVASRTHEVHEAYERLKSVSLQLVRAQELERGRLARELHDEIGQALTVVKINLQTVRRLPEALGLTSRLDHSLRTVELAMGQVRDLSRELRPSVLDDLGLGAALRSLVDHQSEIAGFSAEVIIQPPDLCAAPDIETACFRVVQEALTNVMRHAQARRVHVAVRQADSEIELVVCDDGVGFDPQALQLADGAARLGLVGIQERILLVGGSVEFRSTPGHGTEIRAKVPYQPAEVSRIQLVRPAVTEVSNYDGYSSSAGG